VRSAGARIAEVESGSVLVATIVLALAIGVLHPEFFAWDQIKDVLAQSVYVGILAAGMAFLLSMREIDLSVGSMFGLTLIVSALLMRGGMNAWAW
jgi:ribose transport system permease protein